MKKKFNLVVSASIVLGVAACSPGSPTPTGKDSLKGSAAQLDSASYAALTPLQQYQVANKLTSALFTGVPANDFFVAGSIGADTSKLAVNSKYSNLIGKVRKSLDTPLPADPTAEELKRTPTKIPLSNDATSRARSKNEVVDLIEGSVSRKIVGKYSFNANNKQLQYPLAYLHELPLSDDFFSRWMAYKLVNTIMFSPAEEIDSVDPIDVQTLYENLVNALKDDTPIRSIILAHEKSESNWKRFRSPEDNTREMIEIYLGLFDRDADVPRASKACQNWSLSDDAHDYKLMKGPNENTEPQLILDSYYVTTCDEVFAAISNHPLVIPRVTTVLIDHMFGVEYDADIRSNLARDIAASNPSTFKDLFLAILFSKEFLLKMERPKWFEESYLNVAARVHWRSYSSFFNEINTDQVSSNINASLPRMYQPAFSLKLGRWPTVPSDVLATSYQQNGLRSAVLIPSDAKLPSDPDFDPTADPRQGWGPELTSDVNKLSTADFVTYMFISVLGRAPSADEASVLTQVINTARTPGTSSSIDCLKPSASGCMNYFSEGNLYLRAMVVMDYLSRLPESYFYNAVN